MTKTDEYYNSIIESILHSRDILKEHITSLYRLDIQSINDKIEDYKELFRITLDDDIKKELCVLYRKLEYHKKVLKELSPIVQ